MKLFRSKEEKLKEAYNLYYKAKSKSLGKKMPSYVQWKKNRPIPERELMGKKQVEKNKKELKGVKMTPSEETNFGLKQAGIDWEKDKPTARRKK